MNMLECDVGEQRRMTIRNEIGNIFNGQETYCKTTRTHRLECER